MPPAAGGVEAEKASDPHDEGLLWSAVFTWGPVNGTAAREADSIAFGGPGLIEKLTPDEEVVVVREALLHKFQNLLVHITRPELKGVRPANYSL